MRKNPFDLIVYIGRFQPFHNAHKDTLDYAASMATNVLVLVGSSENATSIKNPWSFNTRYSMINDSTHILNLFIEGIKDYTYDDNKWITEVGNIINNHIYQLSAKKIAIIGHDKDHSSFYLNYFPQWEFIEVPSYPNHSDSIDATKIRRLLFNNDLEFIKGVLPVPVYKLLKRYIQTKEFSVLFREWNFVESYKASWAGSPYEPTFVTVDPVVVQSGHILLIERGEYPGNGLIALPGGFLDPGEKIRKAVVRELIEETGLKIPSKVLNGSIDAYDMFDDPGRSTRGRTITHAYRFTLDATQPLPRVKGQSDAKKAKWYSFADFENMENVMYEDHFHIVKHMLNLPNGSVRQ